MLPRDNFTGGTSTGGKTGSQCMKLGEDTYQVKPPIRMNSSKRRIKAFDNDHENFGEFVAAKIAKALSPDYVPDLELVSYGDGKGVGVASKYMTPQPNSEGKVQTLDGYFSDVTRPPRKDRPNELSHVQITRDDSPAQGRKGVGSMDKTVRADLGRAIALSALLGDHDCNPGNMLVITSGQNPKLARIDFGHAFSDLLRGPEFFGGVQRQQNYILDYFNRERVAGGDSKLWKSYSGMMPSKELVDAMAELSSQDNEQKINESLKAIKNEFLLVLKAHPQDAKQILDSLAFMVSNATKKNIEIDSGVDRDESKQIQALEQICAALKDFVFKNMRDMRFAANLMSLQMQLEAAVRNIPENEEAIKQLRSKFKELQTQAPQPFTWIKTEVNEPPFKGEFDEFVNNLRHSVKLERISQDIQLTGDDSAEIKEIKIKLLKILASQKSPNDKHNLLQQKIGEKLKSLNNSQESAKDNSSIMKLKNFLGALIAKYFKNDNKNQLVHDINEKETKIKDFLTKLKEQYEPHTTDNKDTRYNKDTRDVSVTKSTNQGLD